MRDPKGRWVRGHAGPKVGANGRSGPNRITADVKRMIEEALTRAGGADYLLKQAEDNPVAFLSLVGRILPRNVNIDAGPTLEKLLAASYETTAKLRGDTPDVLDVQAEVSES